MSQRPLYLPFFTSFPFSREGQLVFEGPSWMIPSWMIPAIPPPPLTTSPALPEHSLDGDDSRDFIDFDDQGSMFFAGDISGFRARVQADFPSGYLTVRLFTESSFAEFTVDIPDDYPPFYHRVTGLSQGGVHQYLEQAVLGLARCVVVPDLMNRYGRPISELVAE